jgi:hypothetical protein
LIEAWKKGLVWGPNVPDSSELVVETGDVLAAAIIPGEICMVDWQLVGEVVDLSHVLDGTVHVALHRTVVAVFVICHVTLRPQRGKCIDKA